MSEWLSHRVWAGSGVSLREFNRLPAEEAVDLVGQCLAVERWVRTVVAGRPYRRLDDLFEAARDAAFPFTGAELEAVLAAADPVDVVPPAREFDSPPQRQLREQLAAGVAQYQRRFARPFMIRTDGKSDRQVLVQLWERLGHDPDTEDRVLAQQLRENALVNLARIISD